MVLHCACIVVCVPTIKVQHVPYICACIDLFLHRPCRNLTCRPSAHPHATLGVLKLAWRLETTHSDLSALQTVLAAATRPRLAVDRGRTGRGLVHWLASRLLMVAARSAAGTSKIPQQMIQRLVRGCQVRSRVAPSSFAKRSRRYPESLFYRRPRSGCSRQGAITCLATSGEFASHL